jgi:hypothetical protein
LNPFSQKKHKIIAVVAGFVTSAVVCLILWEYRAKAPNESLQKRLKTFLEMKIIASQAEETDGVLDDLRKGSESVVYVLGGTQDSLMLKFRTAIGLCGSGTVNRIMLLSTPGITEYNEKLGRNLSNDEWALKEFSDLGLAETRIEFTQGEDGLFGTLSEAKAVRRAVLSEGIGSLTLICAGYHGQRVAVTFSSILKDTGASIRIYTVDEKIGIFGLLTERLKLFFYEHILLPWQGVDQAPRNSSHLMRGRVGELRIGV